MFELGSTALGITLVLLGLVFLILTPALLRAVPRLRPAMPKSPQQPVVQVDISPNQNAVILVHPGGRILQINELAREWFGLLEQEQPHLERMARSTRPSEAFLSLCAAAGQVRFTLGASLVEGLSYYVPYDGEQAILVTLQRPQLSSLDDGQSSVPTQVLNIFTEVSQAMTASLNLDQTIINILDSIDRLVPSDFSELTIWSMEDELAIPFRYAPGEDGKRHLEKTADRYEVGEGYTGYILATGETMLVEDVMTYQLARPAINRMQYPFRSYLGIPLMVSGSLVGTLELCSQSIGAYQESDREIIEILAGHAALALQNAIIHENERQRAFELSSLADLTKVGNKIYASLDIYKGLTDSIAPLVGVEIFGFLIYDPEKRELAGKKPFIGMPDQVVELYRTEVKEGGKVEEILQVQDVIITDDVENNQILKDLNLNYLAQTAGMRETVMIPMTTGGRTLGYMQAGNKADGSTFNDDDLRFLTIIAGQAAPIIENATLIGDSRRRTQRAESLRRIASLAGSGATLDEILKFSALELSHYLQAHQVALYIRDENLGELRLHQDSAVGIPDGIAKQIGRFSIDEVSYHKTVTATTIPSLSKDFWEDPIAPCYEFLRDHLPDIRSVMIVPMVIRDQGIGEIFIGNRQRDFYSVHDLQSIGTAAGQLASAVERSTLYAQTDESLQTRVDQLTALTRISRDLNTTLNHKHLLQRVYDEALHTTNADYGSILLFEPDSELNPPYKITLTLGKFPNQQFSQQELQALNTSEPLIVKDYQVSEYLPPAENVRSSLIVPIAYQGDNAGLIHLHAQRPDHFSKADIEITQALAVQAAIAIGNAQRYQEQLERGELLTRRVDALDKLLETTQNINLNQPLEESLEQIAYGIQEANLFEIALIYVYDPKSRRVRVMAGAGLPLDLLSKVQEIPYSWDSIRQIMHPNFRKGNSAYFVPYNELTNMPSMIPEYALLSYTMPEDEEKAWEPGDRLIIPLLDHEENPLGVIAVDAPRNGLRPDDITLETLGIFSTEAALVIESYTKLNSLQTEVESIQAEISRSSVASQTAEEHLSVLLEKDLEQTIAIQQLHERARNIRVGLDIAEIVNRQPDRESVLNSLANQVLTQMDLDAALVAESVQGSPRLISQMGNLPEGANPGALLGQRNPLRQTFQTGEPIFVANVDEDRDWRSTPLLKNLNAKGFISIPIANNGTIEAAILATSSTPIADFSQEDEQIYDLISNQVSITLQNLTLLTETRRRLREVNLLLEFSRQLGSLDMQDNLSQLVDSVRRVISNAHGATVSLWDEKAEVLVTKAASGYSNNEAITKIAYKFGEALPGQVYAQGIPINVGEIDFSNQYNLSEVNLLRYREATGGRLPVSSLLVPIKTGEHTLGVMTLDNFNTPNAFSEEDNALVTSLAQQTALMMENARLFEETRRFNEELEQHVEERTEELGREHQLSQIMLQISSELASSLDLDMVLNRSLGMLNEAMGAEHSTIVIMRPGENNLIYRAGTGIHQPPPTGGRTSTLKVGEGLAGWVIEQRRPVLIQDLHLDDRWIKDHEQTSVYRSCIAVPLSVGADALGALLLYHREPDQFKPEQISAIQAAANQFAVTINNGELFQLIRDQAENLGGMLRTQQIEASRSKAMLEGVADGVLVTDANNQISLFNDAAEDILELDRDQVLGKTLEDFVGLFGGAAQSWTETIQRWSNNPEDAVHSNMYSEQIMLEDGRVVSVHLAPVSDQNEFLGTISIFQDITHQVEVDRLKSEFVATVSHELRTPMTPIKGYVEFLLMGGAGELNEQQTQFLDIIKSNIDRLAILVNDLLDVSRIEAGKVALSFQPVDMEESITDVANDIQQKYAEEGKVLDYRLEANPGLPNIYGDIDRIRQILGNLIDNAYRYSPPGTSIEIRVHRQEDQVQVDIQDQGIGIFPNDQDKIFERFFRGENQLVMETAGTGLGLPIVKELVEMHNGRLWVKSDGIPGKGSTFSFTLPIYVPEREVVTQSIKEE